LVRIRHAPSLGASRKTGQRHVKLASGVSGNCAGNRRSTRTAQHRLQSRDSFL
jgi:hypothetical protein